MLCECRLEDQTLLRQEKQDEGCDRVGVVDGRCADGRCPGRYRGGFSYEQNNARMDVEVTPGVDSHNLLTQHLLCMCFPYMI